MAYAAQSWTRLTATDASANAHLGTSVAVSADGATAVTGSPARTIAGAPAVGAAYAYLGIPVGTVVNQKETALLTPAAADGEDASSKFGASVTTSSDGRTIVVGAPGSGNVYVFTRTGTTTTWTKSAKIRPACCTAGSFGQTLALSSDGTRMLVGSPDSASFSAKGSVWYYVQTSPGTWTLQSNIVGASPGAHTGTAVALSTNGLVAGIGSPTYSETSTSGTKTTKPTTVTTSTSDRAGVRQQHRVRHQQPPADR